VKGGRGLGKPWRSAPLFAATGRLQRRGLLVETSPDSSLNFLKKQSGEKDTGEGMNLLRCMLIKTDWFAGRGQAKFEGLFLLKVGKDLLEHVQLQMAEVLHLNIV